MKTTLHRSPAKSRRPKKESPPTSPVFPGRFTGQVAIVTGGGDGLGLAIASRLASEGCHVWLLDANPGKAKEAARSIGRGVTPVAADICDEPAIERLFRKIHSKHGRFDVLVNSAGIVGPNNKRIVDTPTGDFVTTLNVNLLGSFIVCKHAIRHMLRHNYGRILLLASIAGKEGNAGMCSYSAAKAGVIGLAKSIGKEYAETGVTINALAPAVVRTRLVEGMDPEQVRYMTDKIPMKRCGTLQEVASVASWIVSREASFSTGFTFDMSGGRAVY